MNKKQLIVMWVGIGIIVFTALFPPTLKAKDENAAEGIMTAKAYGLENIMSVEQVIRPTFLFCTDGLNEERQYSIMFLSQFIVALIAIGLIITFNEKKVR